MPRLTKIYTKKGDEGLTLLGGGQRVPKDNLRVQVYGTVDELSSQIGVALAVGLNARLDQVLNEVQNELFDLGSDLAFVEEDKQTYKLPQIEARHVERLELLMDELTAIVGPLENFILPGGRWGRRSFTWPAPSAAAPSGRPPRWRGRRAWGPSSCPTSTASPTHSSSWRGTRITCRA